MNEKNESSVCVCVCVSIGKFACRHNEMFRQYSFLFCGCVRALCCVALVWLIPLLIFHVLVSMWSFKSGVDCPASILLALCRWFLDFLIFIRVSHLLCFSHIIFLLFDFVFFTLLFRCSLCIVGQMLCSTIKYGQVFLISPHHFFMLTNELSSSTQFHIHQQWWWMWIEGEREYYLRFTILWSDFASSWVMQNCCY